MQQEKNQRITTANRKSLRKIAAFGTVNQKHRGLVKVILVLVLLWFYLLSALRQFWRNQRIRGIIGASFGCFVVILLCIYGIKMNISDRFNHFVEARIINQEIDSDIGTAVQAAALPEKELPDIVALKEQNADCVGWLFIPDTNISYPVMRQKEDINYYLYRDFDGNEDSNGCLILDNGSDLNLAGGNLLIHGHNMESGDMFGNLSQYMKASYGKQHNLIQLKTEEEIRTYQVISVFYSKVYYEDEEVFKYYKYFGGTKEAFEDFYFNIKDSAIYDTQVEAEYGDEFITLSTCEYHVENGRFVVVGKRI